MSETQKLANDIGATLRSAERAVQGNNQGQAIADLSKLHGLLGKAYKAANKLGAGLIWDEVAGNHTQAQGEVHTESGGGPKGEP